MPGKNARRYCAELVMLIAVCALSAVLGARVFPLRKPYPVLLERVDLPPHIPDMYYEGPRDAALDVIEVGSFECPFSISFQETMTRVRGAYGARMRCAFVAYPLGGGERAMLYTRAHAAACRQAKGRALKKQLFALNLHSAHRGPVPELGDAMAAVFLAADRAGLDLDRFDTDLHDEHIRAESASIVNSMRAAGIEATPTMYVNGYRIRSALPYEAYARALDKLLAHESAGGTEGRSGVTR